MLNLKFTNNFQQDSCHDSKQKYVMYNIQQFKML